MDAQAETLFFANATTVKEFILLVSLCLLISIGCGKKRFEQGYVFQEPGGNLYNPGQEIAVSGRATYIINLLYDNEVPVGFVRLKMENQQEYFVQLGPEWYLELEKFKISVGDKLSFTGYAPGHIMEVISTKDSMEIAGCYQEGVDIEFEPGKSKRYVREKIPLLMAGTVIKGEKSLALRDKTGRPLWYEKGKTIGRQKNSEKKLGEEIHRAQKYQDQRMQKLKTDKQQENKGAKKDETQTETMQKQKAAEQEIQRKLIQAEIAKELPTKQDVSEKQKARGAVIQKEMFQQRQFRGRDLLIKKLEEKRKKLQEASVLE